MTGVTQTKKKKRKNKTAGSVKRGKTDGKCKIRKWRDAVRERLRQRETARGKIEWRRN